MRCMPAVSAWKRWRTPGPGPCRGAPRRTTVGSSRWAGATVAAPAPPRCRRRGSRPRRRGRCIPPGRRAGGRGRRRRWRCCASRTPAARLRAPASPAATRRWVPGSRPRASLLAGGGGQGPDRSDVLVELQALVAVGIERSQGGRILAGLHDQREACVLGAVEAAVVVPVELVELRAQSRGDAALDHALPAPLEL